MGSVAGPTLCQPPPSVAVNFMNLLPPNTPLLAAADLQEIVFVIVFLVVGFLQWLFSLLKKNKEAAERERQLPPSTEEQEARRRAWSEQTRPVENAHPPQTPPLRSPAPPQLPRSTPPPAPAARPATTPGSLADLMDTLRRSIDDVSSPRPAAAPSAPVAPARPPSLPSASRTVRHPVSDAPSAHFSRAAAAHSASDSPERLALATVVPARRAHPLTDMLKTTHGYKQAFILREVLGPCKALEGQE